MVRLGSELGKEAIGRSALSPASRPHSVFVLSESASFDKIFLKTFIAYQIPGSDVLSWEKIPKHYRATSRIGNWHLKTGTSMGFMFAADSAQRFAVNSFQVQSNVK